ncbi:MAG: ECF-type sigma factor, partial [Planctomycetota bacterium]
ADAEELPHSPDKPRWKDRQHFIAEMVVLMRRLLIDAAKRRGSLKRGGGATHSIANEEPQTLQSEPADTLVIADAWEALRKREPKAAVLADHHIFGQLTWEQAGRVMGIPERERRNLIKVIKAFLSREIQGL